MNFIRFTTGNTNIFPIANSTNGGQLLTEFNLKCRENVSTNPIIPDNTIGQSYTHDTKDFEVSMQKDKTGSLMSTSTIQIAPGRAVINGHFIQSFTPVLVDLLQANELARKNKQAPLKGKLGVGLRAMYSTEPTMSGSLRKENSNTYYEGIQIVVLPAEQLLTPLEVYKSKDPRPERITCHLKLAELTYMQGSINPKGIIQNKLKYKSIDAERILNIERMLNDTYISKTGLDSKKLYTFAGKGDHTPTEKEPWVDSWCDTTDALMTWDSNPTLTTQKPVEKEAVFAPDRNGDIIFSVPHKHVDGMKDTHGTTQYYKSKVFTLPKASYASETSGTVDKDYTRSIKAIQESINNIYRLPAGNQIGFIPVLNVLEDLPAVNPNWHIGDYIVVGEDNTVGAQLYASADGGRAPSTMYVVLPGLVKSVKYTGSGLKPSSKLTGIELAKQVLDGTRSGSQPPNTSDSEIYNQFWGMPSIVLRGTVGKDYFTAEYQQADNKITNYYYEVSSSEAIVLSGAVLLTGTIPLATTDVIGGFYNVDETALDGGYVIRDENGHLRVLDYALLRSGVLAYQLGQDQNIGSGLSSEEIQVGLNEYVNDRIAFPTAEQAEKSPNAINVTIELPQEEKPTTINISNIDSRFGTCVFLHIIGKADNKTTINIVNCEKLRIDNMVEGTPIINIYNTCLYYDADVLNKASTIADLKLWYQKFSPDDPNLLVDNMTVMEVDAPVITSDIDFWSDKVSNDNHFQYGLQSLTFGTDGTIIKCGLYIKNNTTANVTLGKSIMAAEFELPQGLGLAYPVTRLNRQMKITGNFITSYPSTSPAGYIVMDTNFTAVTQKYDEYQTKPVAKGSIAFYTDSMLVDKFMGIQTGTFIDGWDPNSFHVFEGGVIG